MNNFSGQKITINLDFDGTVVTHEYPNIGKDIGAIPVLKKLTDNGHKLILFTMRPSSSKSIFTNSLFHRNHLEEAVNWFKENNIPLYGIQSDPNQKIWTNSPKSHADLIIDDTCLGCPLKIDGNLSIRPFVDWEKVEQMLIEMNLIR